MLFTPRISLIFTFCVFRNKFDLLHFMSRGISLELGGKSPLIVFGDADIGAAVDWIMTGFLWGSGQVNYY